MKSCNEQEKQVIYSNKGDILKGKYVRTARPGYVALFVSLFVWMIVMFGSIIFVADKLSEGGVYVWIMFLLFLSRVVVGFISKRVKISREKRNILKRDNLKTNGATVLRVDSGMNQIYYIEDGEKTPEGKKYILRYDATESDCNKIKPGDRIIVIYGLSDNPYSTQLMTVNNNTRILISAQPDEDLHAIDLDALDIFPNNSCVNINKNSVMMTEAQINEVMFGLDDIKLKKEKKKTRKIIYILCLVILALVELIVFMFAKSYSISNQQCIKYMAIAAVCVFAYFLLLMLIIRLRKKSTVNTNAVTEVVYIYKGIENNIQYIGVYEWDKELHDFKEERYQSTNKLKANEGDILYKLQAKRGFVFIKKE